LRCRAPSALGKKLSDLMYSLNQNHEIYYISGGVMVFINIHVSFQPILKLEIYSLFFGNFTDLLIIINYNTKRLKSTH
jgi:hypothetical protein